MVDTADGKKTVEQYADCHKNALTECEASANLVIFYFVYFLFVARDVKSAKRKERRKKKEQIHGHLRC